MKPKKANSKLVIKKKTIVNLANKDLNSARGGYLNTNLEATCYTWCADCYTNASCNGTCYYSCYCSPSKYCGTITLEP